MGYERTHSFQKKNSYTPQPTNRFATRPFAAPVQRKPQSKMTPDELENEAFKQNKYEAFGLQLKEKSGTITPVEQERLGVLQAKMDDFWAQRQERASRFGYDFSKVSVTPREAQPTPKLQPWWLQRKDGVAMDAESQKMNSPQRLSALPILAKWQMVEPGDKYEQKAEGVDARVVEQRGKNAHIVTKNSPAKQYLCCKLSTASQPQPKVQRVIEIGKEGAAREKLDQKFLDTNGIDENSKMKEWLMTKLPTASSAQLSMISQDVLEGARLDEQFEFGSWFGLLHALLNLYSAERETLLRLPRSLATEEAAHQTPPEVRGRKESQSINELEGSKKALADPKTIEEGPGQEEQGEAAKSSGGEESVINATAAMCPQCPVTLRGIIKVLSRLLAPVVPAISFYTDPAPHIWTAVLIAIVTAGDVMLSTTEVARIGKKKDEARSIWTRMTMIADRRRLPLAILKAILTVATTIMSTQEVLKEKSQSSSSNYYEDWNETSSSSTRIRGEAGMSEKIIGGVLIALAGFIILCNILDTEMVRRRITNKIMERTFRISKKKQPKPAIV